jgi:hypothetical protein
MDGIASRLQAGTAAIAVAVAATVVPAAAHAAPNISLPTAPITQVIDQVPAVVGAGHIADFQFFWFGSPNPHPAASITLLNNLTLPILSTLLVDLGLANKEICVGGAGIKIGSYGGITVGLGVGC